MSLTKYFISVNEPWDFESPDGQNIIKGSILKISSTTCLIFKANYSLNFNGCQGDTLILFPRNKENNFLHLTDNKEYVVINGFLLLKDYSEYPRRVGYVHHK